MSWNTPEIDKILHEIESTPIPMRKYLIPKLRDALNDATPQPKTLFNQEAA